MLKIKRNSNFKAGDLSNAFKLLGKDFITKQRFKFMRFIHVLQLSFKMIV